MPAKSNPVRWSLLHAQAEFGVDRKTLQKRLNAEEVEPGKDGKYSTKQIASAVFGDIQGERLRKTREEADNLALKNAELRGELASVEAVKSIGAEFCLSMRAKILASQLEQEAKNEILADIAAMADTKWSKLKTTKR
jgi:phage terminase Nu1 subunit (DNA packaging protein)